MCQMLHDIIYWILVISFDCLTVAHVLIGIRELTLSFLCVTGQWRGKSEDAGEAPSYNI